MGIFRRKKKKMILLDSNGIENQDTYVPIRALHPTALALYSAIGQSFSVNVGGCKLVSAVFNMSSYDINGILNAVLYAHSGVYGASSLPTGNPLAVSDDFYAAGIPQDNTGAGASFWLTTFTFSGTQQIELPKGKYIIVLQAKSGNWSDAPLHKVNVGYDQVNSMHSGNACGYKSGAWAFYATEDFCFYVYGEQITNVNVAEGTEIPSTTSAPVTDCGGSRVRVVRHLSTLTPWVA